MEGASKHTTWENIHLVDPAPAPPPSPHTPYTIWRKKCRLPGLSSLDEVDVIINMVVFRLGQSLSVPLQLLEQGSRWSMALNDGYHWKLEGDGNLDLPFTGSRGW